MSGGLSVSHEADAHLAVRVGDVEIARYVYRPRLPRAESPKPYLHPVRTLGGAPVSSFRPADHPWHKGIQMTLSDVSGQNFWGGPSYREGGYAWLDNVGRVEHDGFETVDTDPDEVSFVETLSWITAAGERWIAERRTVRFHGVDPDLGVWMVDHESDLVNVRGAPLVLGSPTTLGRPSAGYSGLFWRGPLSWTDGEIMAADGRGGAGLMGRQGPWLAVTGGDGGTGSADGAATVLVFSGSSSGSAPLAWFVRTDPYTAIAPSPSFDAEVVIPVGEAMTLRHRVAVADRRWARDELDEFAVLHAL